MRLEFIRGNLEDWFRIYDDSLPDPPRFNSQIWFIRMTKTPCESCKTEYLPHIDRQRYCYSCNKWMHVSCLERDFDEEAYPDFEIPSQQEDLDLKTLGDDGHPLIFEEIISGPTVRGHGGHYRFEDCWLITGSGVQKALVQKWREEGELPEDWLEKLGENFLEEFVIEKKWKWFRCTFCAAKL